MLVNFVGCIVSSKNCLFVIIIIINCYYIDFNIVYFNRYYCSIYYIFRVVLFPHIGLLMTLLIPSYSLPIIVLLANIKGWF
jgi:hypothetical protein